MSALLQTGLKKTNCLAIVVLTLWLNGFGCALCCSTGVVDSCCTTAQNQGHHASANDCCKKAGEPGVAPRSSSFSPSPDAGCSLLPKQTPSVLRLSSATSLFADALPVYRVSPKLDIAAPDPIYGRPALPANRGSTYLGCCVLLI